MKAPFDRDGSLQHYPHHWYEYAEGEAPLPVGPDWLEVEPFKETLIFDMVMRRSSSVYFRWHNWSGVSFPMFMTDMAHLIGAGVIEYGEVTAATWRVVKRGMNYGVRLCVRTPDGGYE